MADISKITLPSGTTYDIKDSLARQLITSGVVFNIAWDGISAPDASKIPAGVVVNYNNTPTTGTLTAASATGGVFYLVKSSSLPTEQTLDVYDEYTVIKPDTEDNTTWFWQKIGDTRINLTDVVTGVTLNKQTDSVIGADSTFTITQPTISLTANGSTGTGRITYVESQGSATTTKLSASASGGAVSASGDNVTALTGLGTPSTKSAIGASSTFTITQPTISLAANGSTATGRVKVATGDTTSSSTNTDWLKGVSVSNETLTIGAVSLSTTYLGATASGANTAWNSKDAVTAVTGYASPTTDTVLGTASSFAVTNPSVTIASGSTGDVTVATGINGATTKYLSASASGANTAWNNKDATTVLTNSTTITVTKGS